MVYRLRALRNSASLEQQSKGSYSVDESVLYKYSIHLLLLWLQGMLKR